MQGGTCGTENCDGRGLMYSAWPIRVGWVAGSGWMPIWLTNADQLRSAHDESGSQSNQPHSAHVICGSSMKSVFWIWSLRPGCSKVSWDLWNWTIGRLNFGQTRISSRTHIACPNRRDMGVSLELLEVERPRYIGSALYQNHMHRYWWYWLKSPSCIIRPVMGGISMRKSRFSKFQALVGKNIIFVAKPQVPGIPCSNMQSCAQRNCRACLWHFV